MATAASFTTMLAGRFSTKVVLPNYFLAPSALSWPEDLVSYDHERLQKFFDMLVVLRVNGPARLAVLQNRCAGLVCNGPFCRASFWQFWCAFASSFFQAQETSQIQSWELCTSRPNAIVVVNF
jgi:hypothetical protein